MRAFLSLELRTGAALDAMKTFYGKTLDLGVAEGRHDAFTVIAGETRLRFVQTAETTDERPPLYHFAFNIPENKIAKALEWLNVTVRGAKAATHNLAAYPYKLAVEERCSCA